MAQSAAVMVGRMVRLKASTRLVGAEDCLSEFATEVSEAPCESSALRRAQIQATSGTAHVKYIELNSHISGERQRPLC